MDDTLLEPGVAYTKEYKDAFHNNCDELFTSLLGKSGINVEENRKDAAAYRAKKDESENTGDSLRGKKTLRGFLIFLTVAAVIAAVVGIAKLPESLGIILLASGAVCAVGFLLLICLVLNPKIRELKTLKDKLEAEARTLYAKAYNEMLPLLALFDSGMTAELIHKTVPTLVIDKNFNMKRYDYLHGKYGLPEQDDENRSVVHLISGEINGNAFIVEQDLVHRMGTEIYHGSLVIHWTEYRTDSKGNRIAVHRSQTLTAEVEAPKPFYKHATRLIYGNDAAPNLSFTREAGHAERLSDKELERKVKSGAKKIQKKETKEIASGFTGIGNEEFDVLFGALDRDNEVEFRLLFTPLAQKNMLSILKGASSPYGDDFDFVKRKCLNSIVSEHAQTWDFDINTGMYDSYDVDICKQKFFDENEDDFKNLYFDLAPLLAIPLYQHQKPIEYIYKNVYDRNCTARESEVLANAFGADNFAPDGCVTPCILKTYLKSKNERSDTLGVTAHGYRTEDRVSYISKLGGDGRFHQVPVHWKEYFTIERDSCFTMQETEKSEVEYRKAPEDGSVFLHRILARLQ